MRVFGHRGSPGYPRFGENTRASFRKALDVGAAGFELDVRRCGDGTLVVIHDATIDRTTGGTGAVSSFSAQQLVELHIPLLSEVLDEFGGHCTIHVELKEAGLAADVAGLILQRNLTNHVVTSAFPTYWTDLAHIAKVTPVALIAARREIRQLGNPAFIKAARRFGASAVHPARTAATPELIALATEANLPVRVWTVNNLAEARQLRDLGVDAIFSDCPGEMYTLGPDAI